MTNILNERPEDPKGAVLKMLQSLRKKNFKAEDPHNDNIYEFAEPFLDQEDFEAIFDSYDVLNIGSIPKSYLFHALKTVGVEESEEIMQQRYSELLDEETINKVSFVFVLDSEHRRLGFVGKKKEKQC